jgi:hypothetical protein
MGNPAKANSLFEIKTNVQTKLVVAKPRPKNKIKEDGGLLNQDKHTSHGIEENLDPSTFIHSENILVKSVLNQKS